MGCCTAERVNLLLSTTIRLVAVPEFPYRRAFFSFEFSQATELVVLPRELQRIADTQDGTNSMRES